MAVICIDFLGNEHVVDVDKLIDRTGAYGVYLKGSSVLLVKDLHSGRWELPGGGVEPGESIEEGLRREFTEETGLKIAGEVSLITHFVEYFYDVVTNEAWRSHRNFYRISRAKGEVAISGNNFDVSLSKYVSLEDINQINITPKIKSVIYSAFEF